MGQLQNNKSRAVETLKFIKKLRKTTHHLEGKLSIYKRMRNHLTAVLPISYCLLVKLQSLFGIIKLEINGKR